MNIFINLIKIISGFIVVVALSCFTIQSCSVKVRSKTSPPTPSTTVEVPSTCGGVCMNQGAVDKTINEAGVQLDSINGLKYRITFFINDDNKNFSDHVKHINNSVDSLNVAMRGYINFETDSLIYYYKTQHDLERLSQDQAASNQLCEGLEEQGNINVFVTYTNNSLLGYTVVFDDWIEGFEQLTPRYDRIFLSFKALAKETTLIHEIGHFFSLDHTFDDCTNFMSYNCYRDYFTTDQLEQMVLFAASGRAYLLQ